MNSFHYTHSLHSKILEYRRENQRLMDENESISKQIKFLKEKINSNIEATAVEQKREAMLSRHFGDK